MIVLFFVAGMLAAVLGSMLGVGAALITALFLTSVFPVEAFVPLMPACLLGTYLSRSIYLSKQVNWIIVRKFVSGAVLGTLIGARLYFEIPLWIIGPLVGLLMVVVVWMPSGLIQIHPRLSFVHVGVLHSIFSSLFGFGGILPICIIRRNLGKIKTIATLSCCALVLMLLKVAVYLSYGFDYRPYILPILATFCGAIPGTIVGLRLNHMFDDKDFILVFKIVVTMLALRFSFLAIGHLS